MLEQKQETLINMMSKPSEYYQELKNELLQYCLRKWEDGTMPADSRMENLQAFCQFEPDALVLDDSPWLMGAGGLDSVLDDMDLKTQIEDARSRDLKLKLSDGDNGTKVSRLLDEELIRIGQTDHIGKKPMIKV